MPIKDTPEIRAVLLVEDLPASRVWLSNMLAMAFPAAEIHAASSLANAFELLPSLHPHLALIDLGLPDGSGVQLIRALQKSHPHCLCVVSTIFDDDAHIFPAIRAGAHGYILKDQTEAEQIDMLTGIAGGRPPLSPEVSQRLLGYFQQEADTPDPADLTAREVDVLRLVASGLSLAAVAERLFISPNTVSTHLKSVYRKMNISNRAEASTLAIKLGIMSI